jgi:predicted deacylase
LLPSLQTIVLEGAAPGPRLLITGGVHGDEYEPMSACRRLAKEIDRGKLSGRVTLIPCVNEPAFVRGTRTAEDGLDLARVCPGRPDGTITQRIAHVLSEQIRAADYYIDLHTGGVAYRLSPMAGYTLHPDAEVLAVQRRMARAFNLPIVWGTSPRLDGRSLSVARDAGVPAIYAEYEGGSQCSPAGVEAYVDGCRSVMIELGMLADRRLPRRVRYVVEDDRLNAGFLQLGHPSPIDGQFAAEVELDQPVRRGERIGTVTNILGDRTETVTAAADGIVLMLRALPRVAADDGLAMILEVEAADADGEDAPG